MTSLCRQRQEPGQFISAFLPQLYSIWDQLTPSEPKWLCAGDSTLFATYRDQQHLILFLIGLSDIYELVQASLLHRIPLPTLEQAISELLFEETRLGLVSISHVDTTLAAAPGSRGHGSSGGSRGLQTLSPARSSAQTMIKNTMIPPSLPLYKHKALFSTDLSLLSSSSASPYLTNPSIELFPKDVDVPAVLPDDTLHVVPPTIVYPVESSSTDFAPLVPPPIHLPSDLLVRRSTRFGSTICDLDFSASAYDSTLFTRQFTHGIVLLILYMDDMIITENDVRGISELQNFLHRHFKMKDLGPLSYFLGLEVSSRLY
ncbi:hypothetical protein Acr_17g0008370 [Actinidia rufa]|uniref:Reverse transcriptase Ty1/copia-type domain-containing protein n=1 Tax=Actinidia rufa TaxID=165716 RepID=A0A7J0G3A2_9ERIC|nr:hypothetical protein Acr_17g0008370 [Actinidia rufa]